MYSVVFQTSFKHDRVPAYLLDWRRLLQLN